MTKKFANSVAGIEVRKELLKKHLDEVKNLMREWQSQLVAPNPFQWDGVNQAWGWQIPYCPLLEQNSDNNHMIRKHFRSRAFWRRHAEWQEMLEEIWHLLHNVQQQAVGKQAEAEVERIKNCNAKPRKYTINYLGVALWKAFELLLRGEIDKWYKPLDVTPGQLGLYFGAYLIEESVKSEDDRNDVQERHWSLVYDLHYLSELKELVDKWQKLYRVQEYMRALVDKCVKTNDIFYACKFCKNLWGVMP
jgi:hypothetical protein